MGSITTAMPTSEKAEFMQAAHCFNATVTPTGTMALSSQTVTGLSSLDGIAVGMSVASGTLLATGAVVEAVLSTNSITVSRTTSAAITGGTLTIVGDEFMVALIVPTPTGTYGAATTNYANLGSDEVTGTGYTAGGLALTQVTPTTNGTGANTNFSPNPSWTSASITTGGALIYNKSTRLFGASGSNTTGGGRACGVYSFGGSQQVTGGTLTLLMPTAAPSSAIIAIQ